jgi:MFS family permease
MGAFAPGLSLCAVCGEWMTSGELRRHRSEAHPGVDHVIARVAKLLGLYTLLAWVVLILLGALGGLAGAWLGLSYVLWAMAVFAALFILGLVVASRPLAKYDYVMYRCWVCDTRIPHRTLSRHLRVEHPEEGSEFLLSQALLAVFVLSIPFGILLPWLWRVVDPTLSPYLFLGPTVGAFSFAVVVAVYASRWPRRVERAREGWAEAHPKV